VSASHIYIFQVCREWLYQPEKKSQGNQLNPDLPGNKENKKKSEQGIPIFSRRKAAKSLCLLFNAVRGLAKFDSQVRPGRIDEDIKDVPLIRWEPEFKSYTPASLGGWRRAVLAGKDDWPRESLSKDAEVQGVEITRDSQKSFEQPGPAPSVDFK